MRDQRAESAISEAIHAAETASAIERRGASKRGHLEHEPGTEMIRHVWSVLCRHVFVEPDTDEAALTVLEAFSLPEASREADIVGGAFNLVSLWHCDLGSAGFSYLVKVTGPTGKALTENEVSVAEFLAPKLGARSRIAFPGVPFDGLGVYWFRVMRLVDGQEVLDAEVPLRIG